MMLLRDKRLFIVEDNPTNLAVESVYLQQQGARIFFERWGVHTVQAILKAMPIDAILLDLMLPQNVSGFDVFDQIRQYPELAHIPVVAVSAADPDKAMRTALAKGFAGFISKPVSPFLAQHIAEVIDGKKVWIGDSSS